jgi:hypothetical protein
MVGFCECGDEPSGLGATELVGGDFGIFCKGLWVLQAY